MRTREKRKRGGEKQQAPGGACWEKGYLMERQEVRENIREELIRRELKFICGEDNAEDGKPVIGKGAKEALADQTPSWSSSTSMP